MVKMILLNVLLSYTTYSLTKSQNRKKSHFFNQKLNDCLSNSEYFYIRLPISQGRLIFVDTLLLLHIQIKF